MANFSKSRFWFVGLLLVTIPTYSSPRRDFRWAKAVLDLIEFIRVLRNVKEAAVTHRSCSRRAGFTLHDIKHCVLCLCRQSYLFAEPRTKTQNSSCHCNVFFFGSFYSTEKEGCCWVWEQKLGTGKRRLVSTPHCNINWSELLYASWKPYNVYQKFEEYY